MNTRIALVAIAAMFAAGCGAPLPQTDPAVEAAAPAAATENTEPIHIDPEQSWLRVRVYRSGRLARFGHNHVISSNDLRGRLQPGATPTDARISVTLPLASLIVDDPAARAAEGDDFAGAIPEKDRAGTRANMLGEALLNASTYRDIRLDSVRIDGTLPQLVIVTDVTLAGQTQRIELPVTVTYQDERIIAEGDVTVTHEALGLTPFSALLGALRVRDDIGLHFKLVADATYIPDDTLL